MRRFITRTLTGASCIGLLIGLIAAWPYVLTFGTWFFSVWAVKITLAAIGAVFACFALGSFICGDLEDTFLGPDPSENTDTDHYVPYVD